MGKMMDYDYPSTISFLGVLTTVCGLFGGFAFTGIIAYLVSSDSSGIFSQIILFLLYVAMSTLTTAVCLLHYMDISVLLNSQKVIIPVYPKKWREINALMTIGIGVLEIAVPLMFLFRNLIILSLLSLIITAIALYYIYFSGWIPVEKELKKRGVC